VLDYIDSAAGIAIELDPQRVTGKGVERSDRGFDGLGQDGLATA
jgi:hypothetical protein